MGWWQILDTDDQELWTGDDPLDATAEFLKNFSQFYLDDLQRPPTLHELLSAIQSSIEVYGDELLEMEGKELTQIRPRLRQRPKRQQYKIGDVFAIPLGENQYGYGRVWWISKQLGPVCEFFDYTSKHKHFASDLVEANRLFYVGTSDTYLRNGSWQIIGYTKIPNTFGLPRFILDQRPLIDRCMLLEGDKEIRESYPHEVIDLPSYGIHGADLIEDTLQNKLKQLGRF